MRRLMVLAASIAVLLVGLGPTSVVRTSQAATQGRWVMYELGTFGKDYSNAVAINDRSQVVCNAWVGDQGPIEVSPPRVNHAFLCENGKSTKLTLGGKETGIGYDYIGGGHDEAINERGQVVGWTNTKSGATHAFLRQNGKMTDLGTLGGKESAAPASGPVAINDSGQVVGGAETKSGATHPFFWENGKMRDLGRGGVGAINNLGQVVLQAPTRAKNRYGSPIYSAFLWQNGEMRMLGTLGGPTSFANVINDRGQVVGGTKPKTVNGDPIDRASSGRTAR